MLLKSDWWVIFAFYENILVWPLTLVVLFLIVRSKTMRGRLYSASLLLIVFLPHIHQWVGGLYFEHLCKTQAGEFIYRTVDNVEGILQMRPRDGSKDYFDRMRAGDIPEDPWGHTNMEAQSPVALFVGVGSVNRYRFLEQPIDAGDQHSTQRPQGRVRQFSFEVVATDDQGKPTRVRTVVSEHDKPRSKFGFTWSEQSTLIQRAHNIHRGQVRVVAIELGEVMASKTGFLRSRPWAICPLNKEEDSIAQFVMRVLIPLRDAKGAS